MEHLVQVISKVILKSAGTDVRITNLQSEVTTQLSSGYKLCTQKGSYRKQWAPILIETEDAY
jgi:hypothetical protein